MLNYVELALIRNIMFVEGIIGNLIASVVYAIVIYVIGKIFLDWFFIEIRLPEKKSKEEITDSRPVAVSNGENDVKKTKKEGVIKLYRRFPWRHAYKHAQETAKKMNTNTIDDATKQYAKELYKPSIIIGIGRGGAIYGSIFSYYMKETPMLAIDRKYLYNDAGNRIGEDWYYPFDIPKELLDKVLLVAGEYHSGKTMQKFYDRLKEIGANEIRTCVLYYQMGLSDQVGPPDYYGISGKMDCLMPWQRKSFLRTWKESDDAKVRDYSLSSIPLDSLKDGFFLMRHAQTEANVKDIFIGSGSPNENINYNGVVEARNVGNFLEETISKIDTIYCSPLARCVQTATEIQSVAGGKIVKDDRLIEVDFGNWEGKQRSSIPKGEYDQYTSNQNYIIPGSSDSFSTNQARAKAFLEDLIQKQVCYGKRVLVVTHKTIGRIIVQLIEDKEHLHFRSIPMENASLRKVDVQDGKMSVSYYIKALDEQ